MSNRFRNRAFRLRLPARPRTLLAGSSTLAIVAISVTLALAQSPVREYRRAHERQILAEFTQLLAIPNVAADRQNIRRNAEFILGMMQRRGLNPRLLETATKESPPAVYGEWKAPGAMHSIVLYAHYDGQPTDPKQWTGMLPWQPVWRSAPLESGGRIVSLPAAGEPIDPEWRLYGRSSSDDKAGVTAILTAFDALRAQGITPELNIKFIFEGEEEAGSPHLGEIISLNQDLLAADAWIICDGPVHQSGRKQVVFGVRGDVNVDVTVLGRGPPHRGQWNPGPPPPPPPPRPLKERGGGGPGEGGGGAGGKGGPRPPPEGGRTPLARRGGGGRGGETKNEKKRGGGGGGGGPPPPPPPPPPPRGKKKKNRKKKELGHRENKKKKKKKKKKKPQRPKGEPGPRAGARGAGGGAPGPPPRPPPPPPPPPPPAGRRPPPPPPHPPPPPPPPPP